MPRVVRTAGFLIAVFVAAVIAVAVFAVPVFAVAVFAAAVFAVAVFAVAVFAVAVFPVAVFPVAVFVTTLCAFRLALAFLTGGSFGLAAPALARPDVFCFAAIFFAMAGLPVWAVGAAALRAGLAGRGAAARATLTFVFAVVALLDRDVATRPFAARRVDAAFAVPLCLGRRGL